MRSYKEQKSPKSYCLEHTKPIFNELNILNVSNLYIQQTLVSMFKIVKDHSPISVYDMFNFSLRDNFLITLPSFRLNVSQYNFVNRCSSLWNKFIGKVMEKNKPESDDKLIPGSTENSDFCAPVPFVKSKLKVYCLPVRKMGTYTNGNLLISVSINRAGFSFLCFYQNCMASHISSNLYST